MVQANSSVMAILIVVSYRQPASTRGLLSPHCLLTASSLPPHCLLTASSLPPPCLLTGWATHRVLIARCSSLATPPPSFYFFSLQTTLHSWLAIVIVLTTTYCYMNIALRMPAPAPPKPIHPAPAQENEGLLEDGAQTEVEDAPATTPPAASRVPVARG